MKAIAMAVAAALAGSAWGAPPLEVKGVRIGMTPTEAKAALPLLDCKPEACMAFPFDVEAALVRCSKQRPVEAIDACNAEARAPWAFGPTTAKAFWFPIKDGKIAAATVNVPEAWVKDVVVALTEKYGPPTSAADSNVQNRAGATFTTRTTTWRLPDGVIVAEQRGVDIETGKVMMAPEAFIEAEARERAARNKASASKL